MKDLILTATTKALRKELKRLERQWNAMTPAQQERVLRDCTVTFQDALAQLDGLRGSVEELRQTLEAAVHKWYGWLPTLRERLRVIAGGKT